MKVSEAVHTEDEEEGDFKLENLKNFWSAATAGYQKPSKLFVDARAILFHGRC
jgi:hypothetical protein